MAEAAPELGELDPEKLLLRISKGEPLSADEFTTIVEMLMEDEETGVARRASLDDEYGLLVVLARANKKEAKYVFEKFLDSRDVLTVGFSLETLCLKWEFVEDYLERVISFSLGVSWDYEQDVQQIAIKVLGEYLAGTLSSKQIKHGGTSLNAEQRRVLELLFSLFDDSSAEHWTRQAAYFALCRGYGYPWENLPPDCVALDFDSNPDQETGSKSSRIDWAALDALRKMLS